MPRACPVVPHARCYRREREKKFGSSPKRVGNNPSGLGLSRPFFHGFSAFLGWEIWHDFWMRKPLRLPGHVSVPRLPARSHRPGHLRRPQGAHRHLATPPKKTTCGVCGQSQPHLLRPQAAPRPRPVLWRHPCLPGVRGSARPLPAVWRRETGKAALAGRQPFLHQTLCLLRRPTLPQFGDPRCCRRTAPRLENRQSPGDGVHARATPPGRHARSHGHRHRRDRHPQGT